MSFKKSEGRPNAHSHDKNEQVAYTINVAITLTRTTAKHTVIMGPSPGQLKVLEMFNKKFPDQTLYWSDVGFEQRDILNN